MLLAVRVSRLSMKHEKSSNVTCWGKQCSTRGDSNYNQNRRIASSLTYMQATAASKSSSSLEDMHTR